MEEGNAGKWRNEGGEAGRGEHGVKEEGGQVGYAGRGRAWSEGGRGMKEGDADRGRAIKE